MLIVLVAPSVKDGYYKKVFGQVIDFDIRLAETVIGHDNIIVLADKYTMPYLVDRLPDDVLLEAQVRDIWVRDYSTAIPSKMVQFVYKPRYLKQRVASFIKNSFVRFADSLALHFEHSPLVLDGGNVVDNNRDKAIVTERLLVDNQAFSRETVITKLKAVTGITDLAIIPKEDGDTTGHADGMVMWLSENTLAVNIYDEPFRTRVIMALQDGLPDVVIVEIPNGHTPGTWKGFVSACGLNVNSIATNSFLYVPVFGTATDDVFLGTIRRCTDKKVETINAESVCFMGGSVRCLSWQVTGDNAYKLIETARKKAEFHRQ
ncbi:MAG: agmatine deiminase family protein [Syntrophaceae bacterium]|nr:agmatine deiminase family protein [Syntrophaceae bacterium]